MPKKNKIEDKSFIDETDGLQKRKKPNLADYFGSIKDEDILRGLEEDSRKIRGSNLQKPRF